MSFNSFSPLARCHPNHLTSYRRGIAAVKKFHVSHPCCRSSSAKSAKVGLKPD